MNNKSQGQGPYQGVKEDSYKISYAYTDDTNPSFVNNFNIEPNYTLVFNGPDYKELGKFDFNGDKLKFEGEVEPSAEVFIKFLLNSFNKRVDEIVEKKLRIKTNGR